MKRLRCKGGWIVAIRRSTPLVVAGWLLGFLGLHKGAQHYCCAWPLVLTCPHGLRNSIQHQFRSGGRQSLLFANTSALSEADDSPVALSQRSDVAALVAAATTFREQYGSSLIDTGFRVPDEAPWPAVLRGENLGEHMTNVKNHADWFKIHYPVEYEALIGLGFTEGHQNEGCSSTDVKIEMSMGEEAVIKGVEVEVINDNKGAGKAEASMLVPRSILGSSYRTSGGNRNEREWKTIVESLRVYRQIKNTMHVPARFVIPSEPPWPRETWGHKLGARVASIRNQESYVKKDPARRRTLDEMGFYWKANRAKNKEPNNLAQDLKVVPLRVGPQGSQPAVRSANPQAVEEEAYQMFFEALKGYKQVNRDVMVPFKWKVPHSSPWPEVMHGYELGEVCTAVRSEGRFSINARPERQQDLTVLGFEWDVRNQATDTKFKKICDALTCYRALFGDINVPQNYIVPSSPDDPEAALWPRQHHGIKLGSRVHSIRTLKTYVKVSALRKYQLDDLGFVWDLDKVLPKHTVRQPIPGATLPTRRPYMVEDDGDDGVEGFSRDLRTVANLSFLPLNFHGGEMNDSRTLVAGVYGPKMAGNDERALNVTGGMLDYSLMNKFRDGSSPSNNDQGGIMAGYSTLPTNNAAIAVPPHPALAVFLSNKDRENHLLNNPRKKLERLLEKYHEENLIEMALHPESKRIMWPKEGGLREAVGHLKYLGPLSMGGEGQDGLNRQLHTKPPLKIAGSYSGVSELEMSPMMNGDLVMREDGMLLRAGANSKAIPRGVDMTTLDWMTDTDRAAINKQGFVWDEFGGGYTFDQVIEALLFYQKMYGDIDVSVDYVTPYDYEWPRNLSNMKLGTICQAMRCGDIDAYEDPERKSRLDEIGFNWGTQENYLQFQYDEFIVAMFAHQAIRGDCAVEASFVIPDEDPWPLPLRGVPLGHITNLVRHQEQTLKEHYFDRWTLLNAMEFVWCEPEWEEWDDVQVNGIGNGAPLKPPQVPVSQILVKRGMNLYYLDPEEARVYMNKKIEQPDMTDPMPLRNVRRDG